MVANPSCADTIATDNSKLMRQKPKDILDAGERVLQTARAFWWPKRLENAITVLQLGGPLNKPDEANAALMQLQSELQRMTGHQ